jgi:hypothetical protein
MRNAVREHEWVVCTDPQGMLTTLKGRASDRKLRLFACACSRGNWHLLLDEKTRRAVQAAEEFADGACTRKDLEGAKASALEAANTVALSGTWASESDRLAAYYAAVAAARCGERHALAAASRAASWAVEHASLHGPAGVAGQCDLLRDIFGNPFYPMPAIDEATLAWGDAAVCRVAQSIYDERRFEDLPILVDALEDAGCTIAELLAHLRDSGPHPRGCWVLDLLLGKQ